MKVEVKENKIDCYLSLKHVDGEFPASDYELLVTFYDAIDRADRKQVVMIKKALQLYNRKLLLFKFTRNPMNKNYV